VYRYLTTATAALTLSWLSAAAQADQPPPAGASADDAQGLQEIVVTAERREETAQHAPIAISTLSGDAILEANITRPEGLTVQVPALQVTDNTGPYSIFYVRGVGNFAANGLSDPALLFNFDGVPVSRSGTSGFFYDVQRVEILKGPQGTLYGRNATGGAINVLSNKPELGTFAVDASFEAGNYAATREEAMVNLGGENTGLRLAGYHTQHNGYMRDGTDDQDDTGGRLSLLTQFSPTVDASLVVDYFKQGGRTSGGTVTGVTSAFVAPPSFTPNDRLGFFSPPVSAYIASQKDFLNGANFLPFQNLTHEANDFYGVAATVNWKTPVGTVTLVPAYRDSNVDYASFATGVMLQEKSEEKQSTVELRLASDNQQAFRYVVGAFSMHDPESVPTFLVNQQANLAIQSYMAGSNSHAAFANLTYALTPALRVNGGIRYTKDDKSFVGNFGANSYICTNQTAFGPSCPAAPVFPYTQLTLLPPGPPTFNFRPTGSYLSTSIGVPVDTSQSYSKVTWRADVDYDLTDQSMVYAAAETGYKAGGFFFSCSPNNTYKPETITAYTFGSKNRFLDNRLQANIEVFYWKYRDQQISHLSTDPCGNTIFPTENVGQSTIKGIEMDLEARPLQHTLLSADVQYNDDVYDNFLFHTPNNNGGFSNGTGCPNGAAPSTSYTVDCSGFQPPYAPRWTVTGSVQQTLPLSNGARLVGNVNVHYQSETLTALEFLPIEQQPGYALWNVDLTYSTAGDRFYIGAYLDNAFDKTALAFSFITPFSSMATATLQHPRTYGARIGVHY
jgi:iron complex outermembrane receptor protein